MTHHLANLLPLIITYTLRGHTIKNKNKKDIITHLKNRHYNKLKLHAFALVYGSISYNFIKITLLKSLESCFYL